MNPKRPLNKRKLEICKEWLEGAVALQATMIKFGVTQDGQLEQLEREIRKARARLEKYNERPQPGESTP